VFNLYELGNNSEMEAGMGGIFKLMKSLHHPIFLLIIIIIIIISKFQFEKEETGKGIWLSQWETRVGPAGT